ncbi:DEAD/DEAH box helicase [Bacillus piscicola]|uniref:DEAD/DEAH box helicase n=1 Tax=Bacillus piscicola TaxID=1632684 RepID=UPI001F090C78|nr:DEAD/DEAH box helicase [Bacillus piscicola]
MRYLTKDKIRRLAGDTIYSRALPYWMNEKVEITSHNRAGSHTRVTAYVTGTKRYSTGVLFHEDGDLQECECSCPAYEGGMDICKHIAALLLTLSPVQNAPLRQPVRSSSPNHESRMTAPVKELFLDYFAGRSEAVETIGEPLQVEYNLIFHTDYEQRKELFFSVELKIGIGKRFIVKEPARFFAAIRERSLLPITKTFTFDPTYHYVENQDLDVIQQLEEVLQTQKWTGRQISFFSKVNIKNAITIPPVAAEKLLRSLLACSDVNVKPAAGYSFPLTVKREWPGSFQLHKEDRDYYLTYSSFEYPPRKISLTSFYYWNDRLYELTEADADTARLYQLLMKTPKGRLHLEKKDVEQVYANLVPTLQTQGRLRVEDKVGKRVEKHPLQAKIYLDKKEDALTADPLFVYGPHSLHAVTEDRHYSEEDVIIARDTRKEEELRQLIETAGFHWNGESLTITDEAAVFYFLTSILPELHEKADVFMTQEVENLLVPASSFNIESALDESLSWLDISFQTDDLNEEELHALMISLKEKKRYHKTDGGRFIALDDDIMTGLQDFLTETGVSTADLQDNTLRLPAYKAFQADKYLNTGRQWNKAASVEKLLEDIRSPEKMETAVPAALHGNLRDYQKRGFQWLKALSLYGFGGILADDMGLGKTIQTLTYILSEREERPDAPPFLVVAPSSLIFNWEKEAKMFAPGLTVQLVHGSRTEREQQAANLEGVDILITSYPLIRRDSEFYEKVTFHGLILDEAQALKNHTSKTFRAVKQLQAEKVFALSGTPIENRIDELWSLFAVLMPGLFPDIKSFKALSADQTRHRVSPFILRRTKKEVLTELPDKIESTLHCELTKNQRETYVAYLNRIKNETAQQLKTGTFQENRMNILANLTRLRQLCCHPGMFLEDYDGGSGKLDELIVFLKEAKASGKRMLIFSQFTTMLAFISEALEKEGLSFFYLDGSTPSKDRLQMTEQFNSGKHDAFLISLKAGGTGLNLTGADTVILFDLWWNPAIESQAADRAHRIGQKRVVQVIKLISQGTIEEKIQALQQKKKALFDQVIQSGETNLTSLSEDDIRELLEL